MAPEVLVVDDEPDIRALIVHHLTQDGFRCRTAADGSEALARLRAGTPDLIVLDLMLPGIDGLEVTRRVRAEPAWAAVPIIMLTAKAEEIDKVLGLELGADDYITKPFSVREFRSRVRAVLRRAELVRADEPGEEPIERGELRIDFEKRLVEVRGVPVRLTYVEFEILAALARSPGRVFSRIQLLERVWGDASYRDPRTVDVHIRHLREKLESDPKHPELVFTVRGVGYRFRDA
jgi:DNA-binding response OmpR family regulator